MPTAKTTNADSSTHILAMLLPWRRVGVRATTAIEASSFFFGGGCNSNEYTSQYFSMRSVGNLIIFCTQDKFGSLELQLTASSSDRTTRSKPVNPQQSFLYHQSFGIMQICQCQRVAVFVHIIMVTCLRSHPNIWFGKHNKIDNNQTAVTPKWILIFRPK